MVMLQNYITYSNIAVKCSWYSKLQFTLLKQIYFTYRVYIIRKTDIFSEKLHFYLYFH